MKTKQLILAATFAALPMLASAQTQYRSNEDANGVIWLFTGCQENGQEVATINGEVSDPSKFNGTLVIPATITATQGKQFNVVSIVGSNPYDSGSNNLEKDKINGLDLSQATNLTSIGSNAFMEMKFNTTLIIPNNVIYIGAGAFCYCTFTGGLTIPNSVTFIGTRAFDNCTFSGEFALTNKNVYIGEQAFSSCSGLTGTYPADVWYVNEDAFDGSGLTPTTGVKGVTTNESKSNQIYTTDGKSLGNDMNALGKGVYIVNGKKIAKH